jgi:hypothetical protein
MLSAEMKPAIGAFTASLLLTNLLNRHNISLYRVLKHIKKSPNLVQSIIVLIFCKAFTILAGLAIRPRFFIIN